MLNPDQRILQLSSLAAQQEGYFTAKQAISCGLPKNAHTYLAKRERWLRVSKGLYRLPDHVDSLRSCWVRWLLWSRNNQEEIQGALCSVSALAYYGLLNDQSGVTHLAVPESMRKRGGDEPELCVYPAIFRPAEIRIEGIYRIFIPERVMIESQSWLSEAGLYDHVLEQAAALPGFSMQLLHTLSEAAPDQVDPLQSEIAEVDAAEVAGTGAGTGAGRELFSGMKDGRENLRAKRRGGGSGRAGVSSDWQVTLDPQGSVVASARRGGEALATCTLPSGMEGESKRVFSSVLDQSVGGYVEGDVERRATTAVADDIFRGEGWGRIRMRGMQSEFRRAGSSFTLIEMLVVVAIICILAGLLMPSLMKAVDATRGVSCCNNLRQMSFTLPLYAEANGGYLPTPYLQANGMCWWWLNSRYDPYTDLRGLARIQLFMCPSWNGGYMATTTSGLWIAGTSWSYSLSYPYCGGSVDKSIKYSYLNRYPNILLMFDNRPQSSTSFQTWACIASTPSAPNTTNIINLMTGGEPSAWRHNGYQASTLFGDFHAELSAPGDITNANVAPPTQP